MSQESTRQVEFALDNRQIFFLFFGLSVVGCFVFALGVMVGRDDLGVPGAAEVVAERPADLDALTPEGSLPIEAPDSFSFKDGIAEPATAGLPETRDPEKPPRNEKAVKAERSARSSKKPRIAKRPLPAALATVDPVVEPKAADKKPASGSNKADPKDSKSEAGKPAPTKLPSVNDETVMAAGIETAEAPAKKTKRVFTLQLKAYANAEDAAKMADKLRSNGHDVRVEVGEVQGRTWHRVRIGEFARWDKALEAKADFEERESIIAYVVPQ